MLLHVRFGSQIGNSCFTATRLRVVAFRVSPSLVSVCISLSGFYFQHAMQDI